MFLVIFLRFYYSVPTDYTFRIIWIFKKRPLQKQTHKHTCYISADQATRL